MHMLIHVYPCTLNSSLTFWLFLFTFLRVGIDSMSLMARESLKPSQFDLETKNACIDLSLKAKFHATPDGDTVFF